MICILIWWDRSDVFAFAGCPRKLKSPVCLIPSLSTIVVNIISWHDLVVIDVSWVFSSHHLLEHDHPSCNRQHYPNFINDWFSFPATSHYTYLCNECVYQAFPSVPKYISSTVLPFATFPFVLIMFEYPLACIDLLLPLLTLLHFASSLC